jgi:predicted metal-dependent phosphotriesterase family hydrolase
MTVTGPVEPGQIGLTLPHEHVMSTFGEDSARYPTYDVDRLLSQVLPYLRRIKAYGCQALVDCTATHFGRHPELLRRISEASGLYILTNTGYYGAAEDRYVPDHALSESADAIAARWTREWRFTIDDTGIRPGFIKTAVDDGLVSDLDRKLVVAAARTHLMTGLTIQTHTGDNWQAAKTIMDVLAAEGVSASAWVWTHAHQVKQTDRLVEAAELGAWLSLDGINEDSAEHITRLVIELGERSLLDHVLLSHDGDSYFGGGEFRPYHYLFSEFLDRLRAIGLREDELQQLTVTNPSRAFTVEVRPRDPRS